MKETDLSKGEKRRRGIVHLLKRQGRLTLQEIMAAFDCSEATARRDLDLLEKEGELIRNIGGAILNNLTLHKERSFHEKKDQFLLEKEAIARKAASMVEEGDIVGLTGGTTTFLIARQLKMYRGITIVTNAVNIAMELAESEGVQVLLTGGVMRSNSYELCGPLAEKSMEHINIGKMFMGIDGITIERGITTFSELEAEIARRMIKRSTQTFAVFDHTKTGKTSLFSVAPLHLLHGCITNQWNHEPIKEYLESHGVRLYLADSIFSNGEDE